MLLYFICFLCYYQRFVAANTPRIISLSYGVDRVTGSQIKADNPGKDKFIETWILLAPTARRIDVTELTCTLGSDVVFMVNNTKPKVYSCRNRPTDAIQVDIGGNISIAGSMRYINDTFKFEFVYNPFCDACGNSYTLKSGGHKEIKSPGFPLSYGAACACTWHAIVDESNHLIRIAFRRFTLQERDSNGDCVDWLEIYDGTSQQAKSLGKFCSTAIPDAIQTSSNVVTLQFRSDNTRDNHLNNFHLILTAIKNDDELAGLQSVAAILGAISFGIFVGLLLCSVLYKRWSRERNAACNIENPDPENDYDDVIQRAAPPSYRKVMADPDQYPVTPSESPAVTRNVHIQLNGIDLPETDPPSYPGGDDQITDLAPLPPLPQYEIVSESEDEWKPVKRKKIPKSTLVGSEGLPPTYEAITSEGSDVEALRSQNTDSNRNRAKLRSRASRSSVSNMYQARSNQNSDSDSENESENEETRKNKNKQLRLSSIVSSESDDDDVIVMNTPVVDDDHVFNSLTNTSHPAHSQEDEACSSTTPQLSPRPSGYYSDRPTNSTTPSRDIGRSSSYNDLARHAIHNSIGKSASHKQKPRTDLSDTEISDERTSLDQLLTRVVPGDQRRESNGAERNSTNSHDTRMSFLVSL